MKKMNINMINAASFVRDVIQLKCTLYRVTVLPTRSHFIYTALVKLFVAGKIWA
jgi:hypothetical protein